MRREIRLCSRLLISAACIAIVGTSGRAAESAKVELYVLQTTTLTDEQFLTGAHEGKPTTIAGELRLPRLGTDRIPAVVIVHGSGGIMGNEDRWSRELNDMGVATFVLDGFTGAGSPTPLMISPNSGI
jgi:hypothetical protein